MRAFASFLAASLALAAPAEAAPRRVASLNLCTDELVLLLAAPDQIVSVTHLAQDPAETPLWRQGRRYRRNDGSLMSAAAMRPDLIVTMGGGARDRLRIAERLGIATVDLPFAFGLADVEANISRVAAALGRPAAGQALVARMRALRRSAPPARIDTIWLGGGGRTVAPEGLEGQWMALAGLAQRPLQGDRVSLETLIARPPRILLRSDYRQGQYSGQQRWLDHPAARRAGGARNIATDGRRWTCMGPLLIDEVVRLRREVAS
jgi:iron complex transport system substrate-binding protein